MKSHTSAGEGIADIAVAVVSCQLDVTVCMLNLYEVKYKLRVQLHGEFPCTRGGIKADRCLART